MCPEDMTEYDRNGDGQIVDYGDILASDDSGFVVVQCTPPSNSHFDVGTITVTCTATDAAGNQAECSFNVTVVKYQTPSSEDATVECNPPSGFAFPVGSTPVICIATDAAGNQVNCSFVVTIETPPEIECPDPITDYDTDGDGEHIVKYQTPAQRMQQLNAIHHLETPPEIECPDSITDYDTDGDDEHIVKYQTPSSEDATVECNPPSGDTTRNECPDSITDYDTDGDDEHIVKYQTPSSEDATVECNPPSGFAFPVGSTPVICIATDAAGNQANCSFVVTIETPPEIECPDPITDYDTDGDDEHIVKYQTPSSEDATVECNPPSGFAFPVGSTPVICIATDAAGNQVNCSFVVTIETPPEIECPDPITDYDTDGDGEHIVKYQTPSSEDATVECNPPSGFAFPVGVTPVICIATDAAGNQRHHQKLNVLTPLLIMTLMVTSEHIVKYQTPSSEDATVECNPPSGFAFPVGSTPVICIATDAAGNQVNCSFVVTIETPPEIECPDSITDYDTDGDDEHIVKYQTPSSEDATVECNPPSGFAFPVGSTPVICIATDAAGNQRHHQKLNVLTPSLIMTLMVTMKHIVKYQTPSSEDATVECNPPSGFAFPVGSTPVICIATDAAGNQANCSFVVTIETPPEIECPDSITDYDTDGDDEHIVKYQTPSSEDATVECNPPSGFAFPVGSTPVICIATDAAGNQANCSFVVTIGKELPISASQSFSLL
ncbi:hyalin-like [Ptychodera flava]|uniref:hyalin-like n=1 Tax=Ptychodera flava TaxID=63121 RepID=UPI00396A7951